MSFPVPKPMYFSCILQWWGQIRDVLRRNIKRPSKYRERSLDWNKAYENIVGTDRNPSGYIHLLALKPPLTRAIFSVAPDVCTISRSKITWSLGMWVTYTEYKIWKTVFPFTKFSIWNVKFASTWRCLIQFPSYRIV